MSLRAQPKESPADAQEYCRTIAALLNCLFGPDAGRNTEPMSEQSCTDRQSVRYTGALPDALIDDRSFSNISCIDHSHPPKLDTDGFIVDRETPHRQDPHSVRHLQPIIRCSSFSVTSSTKDRTDVSSTRSNAHRKERWGRRSECPCAG